MKIVFVRGFSVRFRFIFIRWMNCTFLSMAAIIFVWLFGSCQLWCVFAIQLLPHFTTTLTVRACVPVCVCILWLMLLMCPLSKYALKFRFSFIFLCEKVNLLLRSLFVFVLREAFSNVRDTVYWCFLKLFYVCAMNPNARTHSKSGAKKTKQRFPSESM